MAIENPLSIAGLCGKIHDSYGPKDKFSSTYKLYKSYNPIYEMCNPI